MSFSSSLFFFDGCNTILMLYKNNLLNFGCYMYKDGHLPHFHSRLSKHSKVHLALKLSDKVLTWPSHLLVQLMCVQEDSRCQKRKWNFVENQIWLCIVIEQKWYKKISYIQQSMQRAKWAKIQISTIATLCASVSWLFVVDKCFKIRIYLLFCQGKVTLVIHWGISRISKPIVTCHGFEQAHMYRLNMSYSMHVFWSKFHHIHNYLSIFLSSMTRYC